MVYTIDHARLQVAPKASRPAPATGSVNFPASIFENPPDFVEGSRLSDREVERLLSKLQITSFAIRDHRLARLVSLAGVTLAMPCGNRPDYHFAGAGKMIEASKEPGGD